MNARNRFGTMALVLLVLVGAIAGSAVAADIVIINNDGAGEGFNDPTVAAPVGGNWGTTIGQQRLIAFEYAAGIWAGCLDSPVPIEILAQFDPLYCDPGQAILGSAGAVNAARDFPGAPQAGTWYNIALANSLYGADIDPGNPDINATFNSNLNGNVGCLGGTGWYYGLDGNPGSDIDFVSVLLHEMAHGLGFQTFVSQAGAKLGGFDDQYMIFLENHGAVPADYPSMSDAQRAAANLADPNLHWIGPMVTAEGNAILSNGISNGHVRMHGPNPYQPGSSVSHWSTALLPNELMEPVYTGADHDPSLAWTLMEEIGWNLQPKVVCELGAEIDLSHPSGPPPLQGGGQPDSNQERGVFFTAIRDFSLCSFGMEIDHFPGQTITAKLYAANGTTRGALLTSGSIQVPPGGLQMVHVPISYLLQECEEYNLTLELGDNFEWYWWNENTIDEPFDVGGVIRVRDAEANGGAGNAALPHFAIRGSSSVAENQSNVPASANCNTTWPNEHGAFVTVKKTHNINALGIRVDFAAAPGSVRAYVYESSGNVRGALVAEGTAPVPSTGGLIINVPINAVLREGQQYNIGFMFSEPTWRYCYPTVYPWDFVGLWTVDGLEVNGNLNVANSHIPAFRVSWSEGAGGQMLDLSETFQGAPPLSGSGTGFEHGFFLTANVDVNAYSFGADMDFPDGATLTARVYSATGTTRGSLLTEGTIMTDAGYKWHDVPLAIEMGGGNDYEVVMTWSAVNLYEGWAMAGLYPINAYSLFTINRGSKDGSPIDEQLLYRIGACTNVATGVADNGPVVAPKFTLAAPYPNPVSGHATLGISLDEAATVTVAVYDVKGRKVAEVVRDQRFPVGPTELTFNSEGIPSGVYFVKMSTPTKSVSRKITIVR